MKRARDAAECSICVLSVDQLLQLQPCGHADMCASCVPRVLEQKGECPVCREHVAAFRPQPAEVVFPAPLAPELQLVVGLSTGLRTSPGLTNVYLQVTAVTALHTAVFGGVTVTDQGALQRWLAAAVMYHKFRPEVCEPAAACMLRFLEGPVALKEIVVEAAIAVAPTWLRQKVMVRACVQLLKAVAPLAPKKLEDVVGGLVEALATAPIDALTAVDALTVLSHVNETCPLLTPVRVRHMATACQRFETSVPFLEAAFVWAARAMITDISKVPKIIQGLLRRSLVFGAPVVDYLLDTFSIQLGRRVVTDSLVCVLPTIVEAAEANRLSEFTPGLACRVLSYIIDRTKGGFSETTVALVNRVLLVALLAPKTSNAFKEVLQFMSIVSYPKEFAAMTSDHFPKLGVYLAAHALCSASAARFKTLIKNVLGHGKVSLEVIAAHVSAACLKCDSAEVAKKCVGVMCDVSCKDGGGAAVKPHLGVVFKTQQRFPSHQKIALYFCEIVWNLHVELTLEGLGFRLDHLLAVLREVLHDIEVVKLALDLLAESYFMHGNAELFVQLRTIFKAFKTNTAFAEFQERYFLFLENYMWWSKETALQGVSEIMTSAAPCRNFDQRFVRICWSYCKKFAEHACDVAEFVPELQTQLVAEDIEETDVVLFAEVVKATWSALSDKASAVKTLETLTSRFPDCEQLRQLVEGVQKRAVL